MPVKPKHPKFRESLSRDPFHLDRFRQPRPDSADPTLARNVAKSASFVAACESEGVKPTVRQARKFLAKTGRWATRRRLVA